MVLVVGSELAGVGVERNDGGRVQIVPGPRVAHPGSAVAGTPVGQVESRVVGARDPDGNAARLPAGSAPGLAARLARCRDRVGLPRGLARHGVERRDEAPDPELAAGDADHDLAPGDHRGQRHVVAACVVLDLALPDDLPSPGVERYQEGVRRRQVDELTVERNAAVCRVHLEQVFGELPLVAPQQIALACIESHHPVVRGADEHDAVVHDWGGLVSLSHTR